MFDIACRAFFFQRSAAESWKEVLFHGGEAFARPDFATTLLLTLIATFSVGTGPAAPQDTEKPYSIASDGTVDWYTYNGFRRYHADCHVCHGPDGLGSSFGPALTELHEKTLS